MLQKIYSVLLIAVFILIFPISAFAVETYVIPNNTSIRELAKINQMSELEFVKFIKEQQKMLDEVFANGEEIFANDQKKIKLMMQKDPEEAKKLYPKEITTRNSNTLYIPNYIPDPGLGSYILGEVGDILVTYTGGISSSTFFLPGHAAIVAQNKSRTVE